MNTYDRIQAAIEAGDYTSLVETVPYATYLGVLIENLDGERRYQMPFREDLIGNRHIRALHGGAVAGFMESATLFEVLISQSQRRIPRVVDLGVDYLRSGRAEDTYATCRVLRHGHRVAQVQAEAWQSDRDKPIAFVRADFVVRDA